MIYFDSFNELAFAKTTTKTVKLTQELKENPKRLITVKRIEKIINFTILPNFQRRDNIHFYETDYNLNSKTIKKTDKKLTTEYGNR